MTIKNSGQIKPENMSAKELQEARFDRANWKHAWFIQAKTLKRAAEKLFSISYAALTAELHVPINREITDEEQKVFDENFYDCQMLGQVYLLLGYAIENLLKGIWLAMHPELYSVKEKLKLNTHDLVLICKDKCKIQINEREKLILETLTTSIEWGGKYPIPLDVKKVDSEYEYDTAYPLATDEVNEDTLPFYQDTIALYKKLVNELGRYPHVNHEL